MKIRSLRTEADYEAALCRIETLWGASPGTSDDDEIKALVTIAETYEREHYSAEVVASRKLARLGGSMPNLEGIPRRRPH